MHMNVDASLCLKVPYVFKVLVSLTHVNTYICLRPHLLRVGQHCREVLLLWQCMD